jgi:dihydrofolate reductase
MKTQYYTATSLDGFIADANHSLEWLFQFGDVENTSYPQFISEVGAIAMGSSTYEWLLREQIYADEANPQPWMYEQPVWVFSTRELRKVAGANIQFVRGDVRPIHAAMRTAAGDKNIWIVGGGDLAGQFWEQGLLDELIVTIASVTLGSGAPLLPRAITQPPLQLLSATVYGEAMVELRYAIPPRARGMG